MLTPSAQAFDAPLLVDCNSNLSGREVAKSMGDQVVRYGVVEDFSPREGVIGQEVEMKTFFKSGIKV